MNFEGREEVNPYEMVIDNGEDRVVLDIFQFENDLTNCGIDQSTVNGIMDKVRQFNSEIEQERVKGLHLGSSRLDSALNSLLLDGEPEDMGLQTPLEQKLVGKLIERGCSRQSEQ